MPFYRGREITEKYKGNLDVSTELFITEEKFREIERKFGAPKQGDLLLTSVGTLGSVYVVKPRDRFYFKDGNLTWFRHFNGLDSRFLYYWICSPQGKAELQKCTIGSSQSAFTIVLLKSMEIELPSLPVQQRIAGILSAYDELIENSQRRIKILESMARALYREWFVHFRFPGHEHHPRVASPLGEIPQGWEVKKVKEILARRPAGSVYRDADVKPEGDVPVIDQSTSELLGYHDNLPDHNACSALPMAIFGDHTCKMQLLIEPFSVGPNVVPFVASQEVPTAYVFYAVNSLVHTQEYKRHWMPLTAKEIVVADRATAQRFASLIQPMLVAQENHRKAIRNLRRTRDLLLPRLLSGQVALDVAEEDVRLKDEGPLPPVPVPPPTSRSNRTKTAKPEAPPEPREVNRPVGMIEREEVLCTTRKVFSDSAERDRDTALRDIAYALGYQRLGTHIREELSAHFKAAVRRGIVVNEGGTYRLGFRSFADCPRDTLKEAFQSAIGRAWVTREEAIRAFAHWAGFARVGEVIDQTARSLINGLIREGRVKTDGPDLIRRT